VTISLQTADGLVLEGEWSDAADAHATAVLCHPHPQYGGTMRSIVTSALFEALPEYGIACLRFNFRGVENSEGDHSKGTDEPLDVVAALDAAASRSEGRPLVVVGWSFGADMAFAVDDPRVAAWVGIAPPLRFRAHVISDDPRAKFLVLAAHDEFRAPADVEAEVAGWVNTRVTVVPGASHFFVGRTQNVVDLVVDFIGSSVS
jgi:alpha/beta superfamily hydrolase